MGGTLLAGCQAEPPAARPPLSVRTEAATLAPFTDNVDTVSTLEAIEEVRLAAQAGGRIQRLLVRQGDKVTQGQILLVLDQTQVRADVARLEAEVQTNKLNYERYEYLVRQGAASAFQRDEFRQRYIASQQNLVARRADLAFLDLKAPISGIVGDLQVKLGDVISANDPFTTIIRNDRLMARVDVPAVFSDRLRLGQTVILMDPASNKPMAQSVVGSLDPGVVAGTQSLLAKAEFANPAGLLRTGLRTRTRLVLDSRQELSVPFAAVTQISGQSFVYEVGSLADLERRPGRTDLAVARKLPAGTSFALQTPVQLGPLQNNRYPVLKGLQAGARVITSNLINLRNGAPVKVN
ncbi:efflux RND transporter periplasmic adaptor subunit [Cyanobium gracile]|uniref:Efflux RND transporter periplasmic adaptor subunit n=1 Tax=Cyanobium gracile UHCC 0281 TaxID=3110309 RepID=A0ABU5SSB1_9CYAN|nr:efflux RND transporter periplasmic adaptor subunit [Cyanobium gracile]MEA5441318.1 efflux RND transporter periplasmic adaptor subunit [Cyanobium gracile UHCC 0281]